jgi:poly(3-hydroxyalkanoate) synthetase
MAGGMQTRMLFDYQRFLEEISGKYQLFGPLSVAASLQSVLFKTFFTDPIKAQARISVRAIYLHAIEDSAPFLYWLTHGTKFPARAHREWISHLFLGNELVKGSYRLPSTVPELDGQPVDMEAPTRGGVVIFDYRGSRDPIAPPGSCVASQLWGTRADGNIQMTRGGLNRTFEKNIGHIFVVSKTLLAEYLKTVSDFLGGVECEGVD